MAWRWAIENEQIEQAMAALDSLGLFYLWKSRVYEGEEMCRLAVEQLVSSLRFSTAPAQPDRIRFAIRALIWLSSFRRELRQMRWRMRRCDRPEAGFRIRPWRNWNC